jgi:beta-lactamase regulating signal transducer with metallopeptidase domain
MNYIYLFSQLPFIFAVQNTIHSIIAAIIIEWVLIYWNIKDPKWNQIFLSTVILLPPLTFLLYLIIDSGHYLFNANNKYIFQSYYWIYLKIDNIFPFALFILFIFIFMTILFFIQEIFPIFFYYLKERKEKISTIIPSYFPQLKEVLENIAINKNCHINVIDASDYIVYSKTGKINNIYISKGVIENLNIEQLKGIILHELAHIERNKNNYLLILYILRIISFFNPVILYEFRRLLQEEEKICDKLATEQLNNKKALAEALYILYIKNRRAQVKTSNFKEHTAYYNIRKRIQALRTKEYNHNDYYSLLAITIMFIIVINYFII